MWAWWTIGVLSRGCQYSTDEYSWIFGLDSPRPTRLSGGPSLESGRNCHVRLSFFLSGISATQFNPLPTPKWYICIDAMPTASCPLGPSLFLGDICSHATVSLRASNYSVHEISHSLGIKYLRRFLLSLILANR